LDPVLESDKPGKLKAITTAAETVGNWIKSGKLDLCEDVRGLSEAPKLFWFVVMPVMPLPELEEV
jgi:hypothetical protein